MAGGALLKKGITERCLILAALLHDIGKLGKEYLRGKDPAHNVSSAAVALNVLRELSWPEVPAEPVAQAVLLHHEARMWKYLVTSNHILVHDFYSLLLKFKEVKLDEQSSLVLLTLPELVKSTRLGEVAIEVSKAVADILSKPRIFLLSPPYKKALTSGIYARQSLPLYYVLQLADNRAAWWREGVDWRSVALSPLGLSQEMFRRYGSKSRILLTLLPHPTTEEETRNREHF